MRHLAIFGCPRSGTSWLGQLFNSSASVLYRYQPLFSYEFKDWFGREGLSDASLHDFHAALRDARSDFVLQDLRPPKRAEPTHLVWKEVRFHQLMAPLLALKGSKGLDRIVYLYRPPVDVLNSWYRAPKEFRAGQDIFAEYLNAPSKNTDAGEFNGFAKWKESMGLALALKAAQPDCTTLISYERLCAQPTIELGRLFDLVGLSLTPQVRAFIAESTSRQDGDAYGVFRNEPAAVTLPAAIVQAIGQDAEAHDLLCRADALAL
jgi:hypothetical protein